MGELCAFKDSPRGKKYWIGTVSEITAKDIHVEYWGTQAAAGTPLGKVRFQTVFTNRSANKWAWEPRRGLERWTGAYARDEVGDVVVGRDLKLSKAGFLSKPSVHKLRHEQTKADYFRLTE